LQIEFRSTTQYKRTRMYKKADDMEERLHLQVDMRTCMLLDAGLRDKNVGREVENADDTSLADSGPCIGG
jgi:hypothetical protein